MPCSRFGSNAAWWRLHVLAHNLFALLKATALPAALATARPKILRFPVLCVAGRLVRHARRWVLELHAGLPYAEAWYARPEAPPDHACHHVRAYCGRVAAAAGVRRRRKGVARPPQTILMVPEAPGSGGQPQRGPELPGRNLGPQVPGRCPAAPARVRSTKTWSARRDLIPTTRTWKWTVAGDVRPKPASRPGSRPTRAGTTADRPPRHPPTAPGGVPPTMHGPAGGYRQGGLTWRPTIRGPPDDLTFS